MRDRHCLLHRDVLAGLVEIFDGFMDISKDATAGRETNAANFQAILCGFTGFGKDCHSHFACHGDPPRRNAEDEALLQAA